VHQNGAGNGAVFSSNRRQQKSQHPVTKILKYFVSLGIVGTGIVWIIAATRAGSALFPAWIALGSLTIVVGLISLLARDRLAQDGSCSFHLSGN
jgi:hypothetical protein